MPSTLKTLIEELQALISEQQTLANRLQLHTEDESFTAQVTNLAEHLTMIKQNLKEYDLSQAQLQQKFFEYHHAALSAISQHIFQLQHYFTEADLDDELEDLKQEILKTLELANQKYLEIEKINELHKAELLKLQNH